MNQGDKLKLGINIDHVATLRQQRRGKEPDPISAALLAEAAGADAIFPEALTDAEMFRRFAREVRAPLLANMTEFGRTPHFTAREFEQFGFRMVIWPTSALRVAAKAIENLYATIRQEGSAASLLDRMQTRAELYQTIGYDDYEALDASIAGSILSRNLSRPAFWEKSHYFLAGAGVKMENGGGSRGLPARLTQRGMTPSIYQLATVSGKR